MRHADPLTWLRARHAWLSGVASCEPLQGGYSRDEKFRLIVPGEAGYLLRMSPADTERRRAGEQEAMRALAARGVRCPEPLAMGRSPEDGSVYVVTTYLEGTVAESALPAMSLDEQRVAGEEAGAELALIHSLEGAEPHAEWLSRRRLKYRRRVREAASLNLGFPGQEAVERFVARHLGVLDDSPVRFQHDDYHPGNLLLRGGKFAGVIDFNRADWGDPVEDFYKVPWFTVRSSEAFARGQVEGYLAATGTPDFWLRYNLFVAMNLLPSLVYEYRAGSADLEAWRGEIDRIVAGHDFDRAGPPAWYRAP